MSLHSQAKLEQELEKRWNWIQCGKLEAKKAFPNMDEWIILLGTRKAFLHPKLKQWLWYDQLHDEWDFAGCGVGEAILLSIGKLGGIKKLPQPEPVAYWCVYVQEQTLQGPLHVEELHKGLVSKKIPNNILVWSTQATDWLQILDVDGKGISLSNESGKLILKADDHGKSNKPPTKSRSNRKKSS